MSILLRTVCNNIEFNMDLYNMHNQAKEMKEQFRSSVELMNKPMKDKTARGMLNPIVEYIINYRNLSTIASIEYKMDRLATMKIYHKAFKIYVCWFEYKPRNYKGNFKTMDYMVEYKIPQIYITLNMSKFYENGDIIVYGKPLNLKKIHETWNMFKDEDENLTIDVSHEIQPRMLVKTPIIIRHKPRTFYIEIQGVLYEDVEQLKYIPERFYSESLSKMNINK